MALIVNIITITGPAEAVFDLVTTARYWPRWHPATLAVGGVTQRPFGLGDRIHERVRFGDVVTQGTWEVVEHDRPRRSVLRIDRPFVQIAYTFYSPSAEVFARSVKADFSDFLPFATVRHATAIVSALRPDAHIWASEKLDWLSIDDGLPQFAQGAA